jgi:hypothetical protein
MAWADAEATATGEKLVADSRTARINPARIGRPFRQLSGMSFLIVPPHTSKRRQCPLAFGPADPALAPNHLKIPPFDSGKKSRQSSSTGLNSFVGGEIRFVRRPSFLGHTRTRPALPAIDGGLPHKWTGCVKSRRSPASGGDLATARGADRRLLRSRHLV